jgi:hypothetical protein
MRAPINSNNSVRRRGVTLQGAIPHFKVLPGEDQREYDELREALLYDLRPSTPYERIIAEQLLGLEWEARRHRRLRDALVYSEFRTRLRGAFQMAARQGGFATWEYDGERHARLFLAGEDNREKSLKDLTEIYTTPTELLAKAYQSVGLSLEPHERKITEIEVRRRRLREDYERLTALRKAPIEDAEIVGEL